VKACENYFLQFLVRMFLVTSIGVIFLTLVECTSDEEILLCHLEESTDRVTSKEIVVECHTIEGIRIKDKILEFSSNP